MTKTILITGATDGIGLLTAQKLAADGHKVLLHGRNDSKLDAAAKTLGGNPTTYCADLSRMAEVEKLAQDVLSDHHGLDVLINNAGILKSPQVESEAGRDIRFDVNTIAPFILAMRLLPLIPPDGRIVNLSSAAQAKVDVDAMSKYRPMGDMEAYAQSKRAITIWSAELAKALPNGPVVVSVNPGSLLASKMVKEGFGIAGNDLNIGADILIRAAFDEDFGTISGRYFDNDNGVFASIEADATQASAVMQALSEITGLSV